MKKYCFISVAFASILCFSCNRDNEILENFPEDNPLESDSPFTKESFTVIDFLPAPGQFINDPSCGYDNIYTHEEAIAYAQERLSKNSFVSLGSWGGYIVVKSPESIYASDGNEFAIGCNSFDSSNEPGIVWVMKDSNKNGLPDDTWYELKGAYFEENGFQKNYWVTYFRPQPYSSTTWIDSDGEEGEIAWLGNYHSQEYYYPEWVEEDSYTLYGSRLPALAEQNPNTGMWKILPFKWGYADNSGEDSKMLTINGNTIMVNFFSIANAVDDNNQPVFLESIDFIKVQTAVNSVSGWLGEFSTEVTGFFISK